LKAFIPDCLATWLEGDMTAEKNDLVQAPDGDINIVAFIINFLAMIVTDLLMVFCCIFILPRYIDWFIYVGGFGWLVTMTIMAQAVEKPRIGFYTFGILIVAMLIATIVSI
jgi:hypothetical protein